jgi:hypothetical protein
MDTTCDHATRGGMPSRVRGGTSSGPFGPDAPLSYWSSSSVEADVTFLYSDGTGELQPGEIEGLIAQLAERLPGYDPAQYFASQPGIFTRYEHLVVAQGSDDGRAAGLLGARWFDDGDLRFLYLWTGIVAAEVQKRHLTQRMFRYLMRKVLEVRPRPEVIAAKTYSPLWYKVMSRLAGSIPGASLYPRLGLPQDAALTALATRVHRQVAPTLEMLTGSGVILGAQAVVGPDFFPLARPLSGNPDLDRFFEENVSRDDQVLTIIDARNIEDSEFARIFQK